MHTSTIPSMEHAWFSHPWNMHGSPIHGTCMVIPSMHVTYVLVTSDNFSSKNSKQLQGTAVAIFSNFCEVFAYESVAQVALWL